MTPHQLSVTAEDVNFHKSRSTVMRYACDAVICSVFRYLADHLTVFPSA